MSVSLTTDSWYNPVTGVGGPRDKTSGFTFAPFQQYDWDYPQFLRALYERDELAAIKVDAVVDDAFAKGWSVEASGLTPEQTEAAIDLNDKLKIREAITQAVKWARLFGGGAVFLGSTDGPLESPLLSGGQLLFARPHERDELYPSRWYDDPLSPKFGKPSHYRLQPHSSIGGMTSKIRATHIHESRFLLFYGAETTQQRRVENLGWGSSVLLRAMTALKQFNSIYALGVSLFADANQNVYKLKGFADLAIAGRTEAIEKRIAMIEQFRSATHALIVDADAEDFVRSQLSLSGMDGVFTQYKERLAAAFQMPLTRLLGVSPAGLNATGESDERNWHKQVASFQEDVLRPALEKWMRVAYAASNGPTQGRTPDSFKVKFPALRDVTPREQAEIDSINMQTDTGYHQLGVLDVPTIAEARFSAEPTRPTLDNEQLASLKAATSLTTPVTGENEQADPYSAPVATTEDATPADDEPEVDNELMRFIGEMNDNGLDRCPHGKNSRCRICGIEWVRSASRGADGSPTFTGWWRSLGAVRKTTQTADSVDAYNPSQPRADDGKFGEGSGGASSGATKSGKREQRAQVKDHVAAAHTADRERTAASRDRLVAAKSEHAALSERADAIESALGARNVARRDELEMRQKRAIELATRIKSAEAGERVVSPSDIEVRRDLPAAKKQLEEANAHVKKLSDELGPEAPEHAQLRNELREHWTAQQDLEAEMDGHKRILKTEAKREKAFGELSAAVESGDSKAIKSAHRRVWKALTDAEDDTHENPAFARIDAEDVDLSHAFKD